VNTGESIYEAPARPPRETQPEADPLDAEIAKVEREIIGAEAEVQTAKTRQDKDKAQRKLDTQNRVLEKLRARKGGGQPGAAPAKGAAPLATVTTPSGAKVSVRKKSE
jgi:hypothetical protein